MFSVTSYSSAFNHIRNCNGIYWMKYCLLWLCIMPLPYNRKEREKKIALRFTLVFTSFNAIVVHIVIFIHFGHDSLIQVIAQMIHTQTMFYIHFVFMKNLNNLLGIEVEQNAQFIGIIIFRIKLARSKSIWCIATVECHFFYDLCMHISVCSSTTVILSRIFMNNFPLAVTGNRQKEWLAFNVINYSCLKKWRH